MVWLIAYSLCSSHKSDKYFPHSKVSNYTESQRAFPASRRPGTVEWFKPNEPNEPTLLILYTRRRHDLLPNETDDTYRHRMKWTAEALAAMAYQLTELMQPDRPLRISILYSILQATIPPPPPPPPTPSTRTSPTLLDNFLLTFKHKDDPYGFRRTLRTFLMMAVRSQSQPNVEVNVLYHTLKVSQ